MQIKLRCLHARIALLLLYCLLSAAVSSVSGQFIRRFVPPPKGLKTSVPLPTNARTFDRRLLEATIEWSIHTATPDQKRRRKSMNSNSKRSNVRARDRTIFKRTSHHVKRLLHEVPSGPNPISNGMPTKLVHPQRSHHALP
ncbi:hypothetical protein KP509_20G088000 [Ceratopteris richardii]|uniref:Secreted protein n=1 Tax=Ceratopteris richardii TaxID=49495 RepID=A0A8T2SH72_CERRI|nr:hypothetical protein KP509_20G088000 [Ceratopteris richardii]